MLYSKVIISDNIEASIQGVMGMCVNEHIVKIIESERAFSVRDAQEAIEKAYLTTDTQTVILLGAKQFSEVVQNKLLKVIEEPPRGSIFILVTQSKATILPTIRSRLPIEIAPKTTLEEIETPPLEALSLESMYAFVQSHKRTSTQEMYAIVERLSKEALFCGAFELNEEDLTLLGQSYEALNMGSPPVFVLQTLLLTLLEKKRRI